MGKKRAAAGGGFRVRLLVAVLAAILVHHLLLTMVQNVLPFPRSFGRAEKIGTTDTSHALVPVGEGSVAYVNGDSLVVQNGTDGSRQQKKLLLPDPSLKQSSRFAMVADSIYWIDQNKLFRSQLEGELWGPVRDLGTATAFDVITDGRNVFLIVSDDRQLRIGRWTDGNMSGWSYLAIQDVTRVKADFHSNGNLLIASLSEYGVSDKSVWWTEWSPATGQTVRQAKIYSFRLNGGQTVDDFQFAANGGTACLFHTVAADGKESGLHLTQFSLENPGTVQSSEVSIGQNSFRHVSDVQLHKRPEGELEAAAVADEQVWMLRFRHGEKIGEERLSAKWEQASHPVFLSSVEGQATGLAWLDRSGSGLFSVLSTNDDPVFRNKMNRFRWSDLWQAMWELPGLLAGTVYALAACIKWLLPPCLYLAVLRWGRKPTEKPDLHTAIALGLYLASKLLFVDQFYAAGTLKFMPGWMTAAGSPYLLAGCISLLSLAIAGEFWQAKSADSPARWFFRFASVDVLNSVLWYGFFIR
ncbi:hypothetical protein [Effusibacillus pohliae]|uniref:hypothetical protein n=1 Tax=Effusibacillus pohliae TaxID=232270 RepID=UPI00036367B4|nr:hypothetical protein [Effusibacillus pohliae]